MTIAIIGLILTIIGLIIAIITIKEFRIWLVKSIKNISSFIQNFKNKNKIKVYFYNRQPEKIDVRKHEMEYLPTTINRPHDLPILMNKKNNEPYRDRNGDKSILPKDSEKLFNEAKAKFAKE